MAKAGSVYRVVDPSAFYWTLNTHYRIVAYISATKFDVKPQLQGFRCQTLEDPPPLRHIRPSAALLALSITFWRLRLLNTCVFKEVNQRRPRHVRQPNISSQSPPVTPGY